MGKINDLDKYPKDSVISKLDSVIGSDFDNLGKTRNYTFEEILSFIESNIGETSQDNKCKVINFGNAFSLFDGVPDIAEAINNLPESVSSPDYKTIEKDQIPVFIGIVSKGRSGGSFKNTYLVENYGKGTYGVNGDIALTSSDLILIEQESLGGNVLPVFTNNPNAEVLDLGEVADGDFLSVINSYPTPILIESGTNWYFDFTVGGIRYLYGFNGANGSYGSGGLTMTSGDVFLVYDEKYNNKSLYNYPLSFSWGDENSSDAAGSLVGTDTVNSLNVKYYNLIVEIPEYQDIQMKDPVLLIDRFKGARYKGINNFDFTREYRKAGYKHEKQVDALLNGRQNEIPITSNKVIINFYDLGYLKNFSFPSAFTAEADISGDTLGYGTTSRDGSSTIKHFSRRVNIALRMRLNEGGKIKETPILGKIKLVAHLDPATSDVKVNYNLQ